MKPEEMRSEILKAQTRATTIDHRAASEDGRVPIAFSSETAVDRGWYMEVLSHDAGAIVLDRAANGLPFLVDHDTADLAGRVEDINLGADRMARGSIRFGSSSRAQEIAADVRDGMRPDISVGYRILEYREEKRDNRLWVTATRWEPLEISSVPVPADAAVGVGRGLTKVEVCLTTADTPEALAAAMQLGMSEEMETADTSADGGANTADQKKGGRSLSTHTNSAPKAASKEIANMSESDAQARTGADNALEVLDLCAAHNIATEQARAWISAGLSPDGVRAAILDQLRAKAKAISQPNAESLEALGASERELKDYRYTRAFSAALAMAEGRAGEAKCFETEVAETLARTMPAAFKSRGGILVPLSLRTAIDSQTPNAAKELVYTQYGGEVIELLRNASFLLRMGARYLTGLTGPVSFPKQTGAAQAVWVGENPGSDVAESNITTGLLNLNPKTLQATVAISRQLMTMSTPDAESMIRQDLAAVHALALDKAGLHGSGASNQPVGIYNLPGVGSVAMGSVAPTFGKLVDMVTAAAVSNALLRNLGFVTTPEIAGKLAQTLVASAAGSNMIWTGTFDDGMLANYRAVATNQVSKTLGAGSDEHGLVFGSWSECIVAQFGGGMEIILDPYAKKKQGLVELTSFQMNDLGYRHPEAFTKATAAKPA